MKKRRVTPIDKEATRFTEPNALLTGSDEDSEPPGDAKTIAEGAVKALQEGKGIDVLALKVRKITLIADYFVIASGTTQRQVRALCDRVLEALDPVRKPLHIEGYDLGYWACLDYGNVIVHVFREPERSFYGLERLWGDAPRMKAAELER